MAVSANFKPRSPVPFMPPFHLHGDNNFGVHWSHSAFHTSHCTPPGLRARGRIYTRILSTIAAHSASVHTCFRARPRLVPFWTASQAMLLPLCAVLLHRCNSKILPYTRVARLRPCQWWSCLKDVLLDVVYMLLAAA